MAHSLEIISGDLSKGKWTIFKDEITKVSFYGVETIPLPHLSSIEKLEEIKGYAYIKLTTQDDKQAKAKLTLSSYMKLFESYSAVESQPATGDSSEQVAKTPVKQDINFGSVIAVVFVVLVILGSLSSKEDNEESQQVKSAQKEMHKREAQQIVKRAGYRCDTVTDITVIYSATVVCNDYQYMYKIEDVGGHWRVTPK